MSVTHRSEVAPSVQGVGGAPFRESFMAPGDLLDLAVAEAPVDELQEFRAARARRRHVHLSLKEGLDPQRLDQAGWGVVVADPAPREVLEALEPLIELRRRQAKSVRTLVYRQGETRSAFLGRYGLSSGPVDPAKVPYYLLIVGPPTDVPFALQQSLGAGHGVGRVDFESYDDYRRYALSVVSRECREASLHAPRRRGVGIFGPVHDDLTSQSRRYLLQPLATSLGFVDGWAMEPVFEKEACRHRHLDLLTGASPPALLMSVCHGRTLPRGHAEQRALQGAQLCQPESPQDRPWVTGRDVGAAASGPRGQVVMMNSCFSAGTPRHNAYRHRDQGEAELCAERPFTARLGQRLLAHPKGGALAVIGHVDRTWNYSFRWPQANGPQITAFDGFARGLMTGKRVGAAVEENFGRRYADLCVECEDWRQQHATGTVPPTMTLCQLWTARNDARSTIVLGDPAVRLAVGFAHR